MAFADRRSRRGTATTPTVDFQEPAVVSEPELPIETPSADPVAEDTNTVKENEPVTVTAEVPAEVSVDTAPAVETSENTDKRKGKRGPRPAINVGEVVVRKSSRTDFSTRNTPTENNPVYLAVKNAELDDPTDILIENDERKIQGALSILRRAASPKMLNVGMHIAPKPYPVENIDGVDYAVITFKTSAERQNRGPRKTEVAADSQ